MTLWIILGIIWILIAIFILFSGEVDDFPSFLLFVTPLNLITAIILITMAIVEYFKTRKKKKERERKKKLSDELREKMRHIDPYGEENWGDDVN